MFLVEVAAERRELLEEVEELENLLFDNSFNATTLSQEIRSGSHCWVTGSERVEGYILFREESGLIDILRIGIHPSYQKRGLGTSLMQIPIRLSERCMLSVRKNNKGAIRLYQRLGFGISGDLGTSWVMATSYAS